MLYVYSAQQPHINDQRASLKCQEVQISQWLKGGVLQKSVAAPVQNLRLPLPSPPQSSSSFSIIQNNFSQHVKNCISKIHFDTSDDRAAQKVHSVR